MTRLGDGLFAFCVFRYSCGEIRNAGNGGRKEREFQVQIKELLVASLSMPCFSSPPRVWSLVTVFGLTKPKTDG